MFFKTADNNEIESTALDDETADRIYRLYTRYCYEWIFARGDASKKSHQMSEQSQAILENALLEVKISELDFENYDPSFENRLMDFLLYDWREVNKNKALLKNLSVTLPIHDIEKVFVEQGIIQLRRTDTSPKILIGCGNSPCDHKHYAKHAHADFVTVDLNLSMNPSVIAIFGADHGLAAVLPKKHYTTLTTEAIDLGYVQSVAKILESCMQSPYKNTYLSMDGLEIEERQSSSSKPPSTGPKTP